MRNSKHKSMSCTVPLMSDHCPQGGHSCCWCGGCASQAKVSLRWGHGPAGKLRGENSPQRGPGLVPQGPHILENSLSLQASLFPSPDILHFPISLNGTPASVAETETLALSLTPLFPSNPTSNQWINPISSIQDQIHDLWGSVSNENGGPRPKCYRVQSRSAPHTTG